MLNCYDIGDVVRVTGTFTTAADVAQDPTAVTLVVKTPDGVSTTYTYGVSVMIVKASTGVYYADIAATEAGVWWTRWAATGTGASAEERSFLVNASKVL